MNYMKNKEIQGLITAEETSVAGFCMDALLKNGASDARISLSKSTSDTVEMLNGELDKVSHSSDRAIVISVFADGKYGTFSTNMLERKEIEGFAAKAVRAVRLMEEDRDRCLPPSSRTAKDAITGRETGLFDEKYADIDAERRFRMAENECMYGKFPNDDRYDVISEECEYSDLVEDNYLIDSAGFSGRHTESSFVLSSEMTIKSHDGKKFSGSWWESSPFIDRLDTYRCTAKALERAIRQLGLGHHEGGRLAMVVDTTVSSKLIAPVISALNAFSIYQKSSFLEDSLGKKVFSDGMTLMDLPRTYGKPGARLYDSEGVATKDAPVIKCGQVCNYFINTYMSAKMNMEPTVESISRPVLLPWNCPEDNGITDADALMKICGKGILVTGFNGGNCNGVTGDFSYGIEGFAFENGEILHPVREMLITGNILGLWNNLVAAGNDSRECRKWQIPSLAFENVDFSG